MSALIGWCSPVISAPLPAGPLSSAGVPAAAELLPGYDVTTWMFRSCRAARLHGHAILNKTMNESLVDESVRQRMAAAGVVVKTSTPQAFGDFMASEYKRWDAVREAAGIPQQ